MLTLICKCRLARHDFAVGRRFRRWLSVKPNAIQIHCAPKRRRFEPLRRSVQLWQGRWWQRPGWPIAVSRWPGATCCTRTHTGFWRLVRPRNFTERASRLLGGLGCRCLAQGEAPSIAMAHDRAGLWQCHASGRSWRSATSGCAAVATVTPKPSACCAGNLDSGVVLLGFEAQSAHWFFQAHGRPAHPFGAEAATCARPCASRSQQRHRG